jgi:hypothetical protein
MSGTCSTRGEEMHIEFWSLNLKGGDCLGDIKVDGY